MPKAARTTAMKLK